MSRRHFGGIPQPDVRRLAEHGCLEEEFIVIVHARHRIVAETVRQRRHDGYGDADSRC